jgi:hypothetical protein
MAWIRRRQERRAAVRAARLLLVLENLSSGRAKPRQLDRVSLGAGR